MDIFAIKEVDLDTFIKDEEIDCEVMSGEEIVGKIELKVKEDLISDSDIKEEPVDEYNSTVKENKTLKLQCSGSQYAVGRTKIKNKEMRTKALENDAFLNKIIKSKWPRVLVHKLPLEKYHQSLHGLNQYQNLWENFPQTKRRGDQKQYFNLEHQLANQSYCKKTLDLTKEKSALSQKTYKFNNCSYAVTKLSHFQIHLQNQAVKKPYKCMHCSFETVKKSHFQMHLRIHSGEKPFKCDHCAFSAAQKSGLQIHLRIHSGEKPFKCDHCAYSAADSSNLQKHLRIHSGEKPFKCDNCAYSTAQKSNLQTHLRIHSSEKPFKCDHCSYKAAHKSGLQSHLRIHSDEKPFKCDYCAYSATHKLSLQRHLRIHSGERPFQCDQSSKHFKAHYIFSNS